MKLKTTNLSGLWSYCQRSPSSAFDPATFDFATACVDAMALLQPTTENWVSFVDQGVDYLWGIDSDPCIGRRLLLTPNNEVLEPYCHDGVTQLTELDTSASGPFLHEGSDGNTYLYYSPDGEPYVYPELLAAADTPSLVAACSKAPHTGGLCEADGITFPFGPSGVGAPPDERLARTWLLCVPTSDADDEIVKACNLSLQTQGADYYRFNADGTFDYFGTTGDNAQYDAQCRQATVGATDTELKFFHCVAAASTGNGASELGTAQIAAVTTPYELRTIDGSDYLLWYEPDEYGFELHRVAVAAPDIEPDPCAGAALPACVLNEAW
jgi:hypothetical protein